MILSCSLTSQQRPRGHKGVKTMKDLSTLVKVVAKKKPDKTAVLLPNGSSISYSALNRAIDAATSSLIEFGLREEEPVVILLPNSLQFIIQALAVIRAGGIIIPINPSFGLEELGRIAHFAGVQRWIVWRPLIAQLPLKLNGISILHIIPDHFLFQLSNQARYLLMNVHYSETVALMLTTGTTGSPKASPLTHAGFLYVLEKTQGLIPDVDKRVFSAFLPMFHVFGFTFNLLAPLYFGATIALSESFTPTKAPAIVNQLIEQKVDLITAVPTIYQVITQILIRNNLRLASDVICINGGDYLSPKIFDLFYQATGICIRPGYGLTETHSLVSVRSLIEPYDERVPTACVGQPIVQTKVIALREPQADPRTKWRKLPPGQDGEICFSTQEPNIISRYLGSEEDNAYCFQNGWFATGDIGRLDDEGNLYVIDRVKDIIIIGGANVYPREIEDVLLRHPQVAQAACIGVPDPERGERIRAYLVLKPGESVKPQEIRAFVRAHLSSLKVPSEIEFRQSLPMIGVKVNKTLLRKEVQK